jgi:hypothetical protein
MSNVCTKCGGKMEAGVATAHGLIAGAVGRRDEPRLQFVIPGVPTSTNPITAFKQGLADQQALKVFWIEGHRCADCGFLELFARRTANL